MKLTLQEDVAIEFDSSDKRQLPHWPCQREAPVAERYMLVAARKGCLQWPLSWAEVLLNDAGLISLLFFLAPTRGASSCTFRLYKGTTAGGDGPGGLALPTASSAMSGVRLGALLPRCTRLGEAAEDAAKADGKQAVRAAKKVREAKALLEAIFWQQADIVARQYCALQSCSAMGSVTGWGYAGFKQQGCSWTKMA